MRLRLLYLAATLIAATLGLSAAAHAAVTMPTIISDGMILQQKTPVRIYGKARAGEKITVSFRDQHQDTTTGADGVWQVMLKPLKAGGPDVLTVKGDNTVTIRDVLVGEVWVASGQSNMEFGLGGAYEAQKDIAASTDPRLRMFTVTKNIARAPQADILGGAWQSASPQTSGGFSAVGYYFARALRRAHPDVPVGVIHTSWGGTRIEAWTSKDVLLANGTPASEFRPTDESSPEFKAATARYESAVAAWKAAGSPAGPFNDPGRAAVAAGWENPETDDSGWARIAGGTAWETSGIEEMANLDGGVWFRKIIDVPAIVSARPMTLSLGAIDDTDTTYVNGVKVGATGTDTPNFWAAPRLYPVPAGVLKPGRNVVAVRVWDSGGAGGMTGPTNAMYLEERLPAGVQPVAAPWKASLAGEWRYRIENGRPGSPGAPPNANDPNMASGLYNAMLAPIVKYTIKGALWYQGESNAGNAVAYRTQLPAMITNWRHDWGVGDFPFLVVQLAPFMAVNAQPEDTDWARLREAQLAATTAIPKVGVAVITDVGEANDIHPKKKGPVGERLALLARGIAYGEKIVDNGPIFRRMKIEDNRAILTFDSAGDGLEARAVDTAGNPVPDGKLVGFAVAGADGKFVWADAHITGKDTVEVSSPQVPHPVAVRYGWANYPVVNLWNRNGLPATPFRTDTLPKR